MDPLKILYISPVMPLLFTIGGTVITSFALAQALVRQGHQIFWLATDARRHSAAYFPVSQDVAWEGLTIRCCKMRGPQRFFWSEELRKQVRLRAPHYDIAMVRSCWTFCGPAAATELSRAAVPYLAYPEGSLDPWTLRYGRWKKRVMWELRERAYFQGAAAIVALTQAEAGHIQSMGLTNRVAVIPNGVDLGELAHGASRAELEASWPALAGRRWILFLGRLHHKKGLDNLIPAFARVASNFPDHLLIIAGPLGDYGKIVQGMVKDFGLEPRVVFTGMVTGVLKVGLLMEADLFVLTSYSEGLPMAILEAMGCSTPVLISQECNLPKVAEAGAGVVVASRIPEVARAMEIILRDEAGRAAMGQRARELAATRFSWDTVARETAALCQDILLSKKT